MLCPAVFCTVYSTAYVACILAVSVHEAVACTRANGQLLRDCSAMAFQLVIGHRSGLSLVPHLTGPSDTSDGSSSDTH